MPVTARSFAAATIPIALFLAATAASSAAGVAEESSDGDFGAHSRHHRRAMGMGHQVTQTNRPEPRQDDPDPAVSDRERRDHLGGSGSGSGSGGGGGCGGGGDGDGEPQALEVTSGSRFCQIDANGCATDGAGEHGNNEACMIQVTAAGYLTATEFDTESCCDRITIDGTSYQGSTAPDGVAVSAGSTIQWRSDFSITNAGWTICFEPAAVATGDGSDGVPATGDIVQIVAQRESENTDASARGDEWRATAREQLLLARVAEHAVATADPAAADYQALVAAANTARGTAEAAQVARAAREDEEVAARTSLAAALTEQQCGATGDMPVDCVVSAWSIQEACPADAAYSCGPTTQLELRTVVQAAMCGGAACGPLVRVSPCVSGSTGDVLDYRCDFNATFTVGQTLVLGGVSIREEDAVTSALRDILRTFYRTVLGHDRFRLAFKRWNAEESIAMPDARRRRQDIAGRTAAETFPDAEIDFEVQVDPFADPEEAQRRILAGGNEANLLEALHMTEILAEQTEGSVLSIGIEGHECVPEECDASTSCTFVPNGCFSRVPCGNCNLRTDCGINLYACINDGDCSRLSESLNDDGSIDGCLLDTSQFGN